MGLDIVRSGSEGQDENNFEEDTVVPRAPIPPVTALCRVEFFMCATLSRRHCSWLKVSSRKLNLAPGLCGVTLMIGTMLLWLCVTVSLQLLLLSFMSADPMRTFSPPDFNLLQISMFWVPADDSTHFGVANWSSLR